MGFSDRDEKRRASDTSHWTFIERTPTSEDAPPEEWVEIGPMRFDTAILCRPGQPDVVIDLRKAKV